MRHPDNIPATVTEAAGNRIDVAVYDVGLVPRLEHLGFHLCHTQDPPKASIRTTTVQEKAGIFADLISLNACFAYGHGWSLSEVAEHLRNQGHLSGRFKRLSWVGLGKPPVVDEI